MKKMFQIAVLCYAVFLHQAHAEFVEIDWKVEGDASASLDTSTSIEWLRLSETKGMSISEVKAEMSLGEQSAFYGWRLPTEHEVESMMENIFDELIVEGDSSFLWNSNQTDVYAGFSKVFDWVYAYKKTGYPAKYDYRSYGLYKTDSAEVNMSGVRYTNLPKTGQSQKRVYTTRLYEDYDNGSYSEDYKSSSYGVFLVSDGGYTMRSLSDVSAPALAMLPLIGLFGLMRRKQKSS